MVTLISQISGVAKALYETPLTTKGDFVGTLLYAAPERCWNPTNDWDKLEDIYALGVMVFEMLTGRRPFATIPAITSSPVPHVTDFNPNLPKEFNDILTKAMAKEPKNRYQTAKELLEDFRRAISLSLPSVIEQRSALSETKAIVADLVKIHGDLNSDQILEGVQLEDVETIVGLTLSEGEQATRQSSISQLADNPPEFISLTGFGGRKEELRQLDEWFSSSSPVACIIGQSGIGKTWLVHKWGSERFSSADNQKWCYLDVTKRAYIDTDDGEEAAKRYTHHAMEHFANRMGLDSWSEQAIARNLRGSDVITILDSAEYMLWSTRKQSGIPAIHFRRFVDAFVNSSGSGKLILVYSVRPVGIADEKHIVDGLVTVIRGSNDPWQLGGLTLDDVIEVVDSWDRFGAVRPSVKFPPFGGVNEWYRTAVQTAPG